DGRHFAGWDVYHLKCSPVDPNRLYAAQSRGWFGQVVQRSDDGGATWNPVGNEFKYESDTHTHKWYDNSDHPYEFLRVWHLEPSLTDPDTVYAGVEDASLFKSTDAGKTWEELSALRTHPSAPTWAPGAGGLCLHTIILDKTHPDRIITALSSATCRPTSALSSTCIRMSRRPSTSFPSRATQPTSFRRGSCASTVAARAATSGRPSRRDSLRRTATRTCSATPWPWTRSTLAAS